MLHLNSGECQLRIIADGLYYSTREQEGGHLLRLLGGDTSQTRRKNDPAKKEDVHLSAKTFLSFSSLISDHFDYIYYLAERMERMVGPTKAFATYRRLRDSFASYVHLPLWRIAEHESKSKGKPKHSLERLLEEFVDLGTSVRPEHLDDGNHLPSFDDIQHQQREIVIESDSLYQSIMEQYPEWGTTPTDHDI